MSESLSAVILAAGKSTRTYPITLNTPKGLLKVLNKPILQRTLDELIGLVQRVYIIVGYKKEMIQHAFGSHYEGIELIYIEQKEVTGTGSAILQLKGVIQGKFLVLNGDDLYKKEDIRELLKYPYGVLAQKVSDPSRFGVFQMDSQGKLLNIIEKPKENIGNLVNTGCYLFDEKIFEYILQKSPRGEYEITDYLLYLAQQYGVQVVPVKKYWVALGYSWDLLKANQFVLKYDFGEEKRESDIPEHVSVTGSVSIGSKVIFGKNVQLFGPIVIGNEVRINDNAYILPYTVIENDVVVDEECMIADSLITDHSFLHRDAKRRGAIVTSKYTITMNT